VKADEAEREIRAQVRRALNLGIHPTHLDTHMGAVIATPAIFAAYLKVAQEYQLPFLAGKVPGAESLLASRSDKDVVLDSIAI
jgi:hypothetical protein